MIPFSKQPHQYSVEKVQDYGICLGYGTCASIYSSDSVKTRKNPSGIFECQAYAKPIICISEGETTRYLEATSSALVVKPNVMNGFADATVRLYEDRMLAVRLGRNGWRYVSENLTAEKIGESIYKILVSVV